MLIFELEKCTVHAVFDYSGSACDIFRHVIENTWRLYPSDV